MLKDLDEHIAKSHQQEHREHLGASEIGGPCERAIWYSFRWFASPKFSARVLRIFKRGTQIEDDMLADLKTRHQVWTRNSAGEQYGFADLNGHFSGHADGVVKIDDEAYLLECKSARGMRFAEIVKKGVQKAKGQYHAQMLLYMHKMGLKRGILWVENKDTSERHTEIVEAKPEIAAALIGKAKDIIESNIPPPKIGDASWYECKMCSLYAFCQKKEGTAEVNCRTCRHSQTGTQPGAPKWMCGLTGEVLEVEKQKAGCGQHSLISEV